MARFTFDIKTTSLPGVTGLVPITNICLTCHKSPPNHGTAEFDKLLLETEQVAHGNNIALTSKLCPQLPSCLTQLIIVVGHSPGLLCLYSCNNSRDALPADSLSD